MDSGDKIEFNRLNYLPKGERCSHLALIPDGARRWANENGVTLDRSYQCSVEKLSKAVPALFELGVAEISILCSVVQNRSRVQSEVESFVIAGLLLETKMFDLAKKGGYSFVFLGLTDERQRTDLVTGQELDIRKINVVFDYDPFEEIRSALEKATRERNDQLQTFFAALQIQRPIDFVIRTGGYKTLSNFFPLLIGYSRMEFLAELFNDVSEEKLLRTYEAFFELPRRYGV